MQWCTVHEIDFFVERKGNRDAGVGGQAPPPPFLTDQLTLFGPGRGGRFCLPYCSWPPRFLDDAASLRLVDCPSIINAFSKDTILSHT